MAIFEQNGISHMTVNPITPEQQAAAAKAAQAGDEPGKKEAEE